MATAGGSNVRPGFYSTASRPPVDLPGMSELLFEALIEGAGQLLVEVLGGALDLLWSRSPKGPR